MSGVNLLQPRLLHYKLNGGCQGSLLQALSIQWLLASLLRGQHCMYAKCQGTMNELGISILTDEELPESNPWLTDSGIERFVCVCVFSII